MAVTLVLANRKGGSGKTTSSINIADALARKGKKVLLLDFDSQAQATTSCGILSHNLEMSVYELIHLMLNGRKVTNEISATIIKGKKPFDILPSKADLSALEVEAGLLDGRETLLKNLLLEIEAAYDYILIDLPPSLGFTTINGLVAANRLIIPMELTFLAMDGLAQMMGILYRVNAELNPDLSLMGILPVKCDLRTNLARSVAEEIRQNFGEERILCPVRNDIKLAEAPSFGETIFEYAINCRGASDYGQLGDLIISREGF